MSPMSIREVEISDVLSQARDVLSDAAETARATRWVKTRSADLINGGGRITEFEDPADEIKASLPTSASGQSESESVLLEIRETTAGGR